MTIGLLGDVMLGRGVGDELRQRRPEDLWGERLRSVTGSLDLLVGNLECCISTRGSPTTAIPGKPFFFRAPPQAVGALEALGVRAVSLANNHALDYGADALVDTIAALDAAGVALAGAGADDRAARRPALVTTQHGAVALLAVTDHPPEYAAGDVRPGVAYADLQAGAPGWLLEEIESARAGAATVVVTLHWGPNMTSRPATWQQRLAHELQDAGADLVAGHSAHVFHGIGWTERGPVLYDLGDAIDDYAVDPRLRNDLGILAVWHPEDELAALEVFGLRLDYARTDLAAGADADWIAARLETACRELGTAVTRTDEQRFAIAPAR